jgi:hypothetical protein
VHQPSSRQEERRPKNEERNKQSLVRNSQETLDTNLDGFQNPNELSLFRVLAPTQAFAELDSFDQSNFLMPCPTDFHAKAMHPTQPAFLIISTVYPPG